MYCSTQSGYSAQVGNGVISQELEGGAPRHRRALKGTYHSVNVEFVVQEAGYQYLMAFYRVWARNSSQRFLAQLCIDDPIVQPYQCYFTGAPTLSSKEANVYTVTAQFRVKPLKIDAALDELIVTSMEDGQALAELFDPLEELVNESLPNALGGVK